MKAPPPVPAGVVILLGYVVLLSTVPYTEPWAAQTFSEAAVRGYRTDVAFACVAAWSAVSLSVLAFMGRTRASLSAADDDPPGGDTATPRAWTPRDVAVCVAVGALMAAPYWPRALARHGPYGEDLYFLNVLLRIACGQEPYQDFEFLYGPAMLAPAAATVATLGFSSASYYTYVACLIAAGFGILWGILQRTVPGSRSRVVALALMAPLLVDTLLGLNWNPVRRLLPLLAIVLFCARPLDLRFIVAGAAVLGLAAAYSHDYAAVAVVALAGLSAVMTLRDRTPGIVRKSGLLLAGAGLTWAGLVWLLLGDNVGGYVATASQLTGQWAAGLGGFRFYWTINSFAVFGLIALSLACIGPALIASPRRTMSAGDRLLLAATLFGLVGLRSGLHRSDFWHLDGAVLPLVLAWLASWPRSAFRADRPARVTVLILIVTLGTTALIGAAPSAGRVGVGLVRGARDILHGVTVPPVPVTSRTTSVQAERSRPSQDLLALAAWLARPDMTARPVTFYADAWTLPIQVGVCRSDYLVDDFLLPARRQTGSAYLESHPDLLIVISRGTYERLFDLPGAQPLDLGWLGTQTQQLARWTSSVHVDALRVEFPEKEAAWRRQRGEYVRQHFEPLVEHGRWLVLGRQADQPAISPSSPQLALPPPGPF